MIKSLLRFVPAKWRIREEAKAKGEVQLALADNSLAFWEQRLGWSSEAARYLATAFAFGVRENIAAVLEKAQQLSDSVEFEGQFVKRVSEDSSVTGAVLEASKFTSSEELRDLLGRILVGEVGKPGSVSRRAVSVAQDLTAHDLREFLRLRAATWRKTSSDQIECILVLGKREGLYGSEFLSFGSDEIGVDYYTFGEFQQLGLLQERAYGLSVRFNSSEDEYCLANGERVISVRSSGSEISLVSGTYAFTKAGHEILRLFIDDKFDAVEGYFEEVCDCWRQRGFEVVEVSE